MTDAIKQARSTFNVIDRLKARPLLTDKITVYTDETVGRELGGEEATVRRVAGIEMPGKPRRWGVLGEIAALGEKNAALQSAEQSEDVVAEIAANDARISELLDRAEELKKTLAASGLTFHLQALPPEIRDAAHVAARRHIGAPEDLEEEIPEDQQPAYDARDPTDLMSRVIVDTHDAEGAPAQPLTADDMDQLPRIMPGSEFARLAAKIRDLLYNNTNAESVVDSADF